MSESGPKDFLINAGLIYPTTKCAKGNEAGLNSVTVVSTSSLYGCTLGRYPPFITEIKLGGRARIMNGITSSTAFM